VSRVFPLVGYGKIKKNLVHRKDHPNSQLFVSTYRFHIQSVLYAAEWVKMPIVIDIVAVIS